MPKIKFHPMNFEDDLKILKKSLPFIQKIMPKIQKLYLKNLDPSHQKTNAIAIPINAKFIN